MDGGRMSDPSQLTHAGIAPAPTSPALVLAIVLLVLSVIGSGVALLATGTLGGGETDLELIAYREDARTALREFQSLDEELDDGLKYFEYEILTERVEDALDDLEVAMPTRLHGDVSYLALSRALDEYQAAQEAWSENLDCTYCDTDDVEPTLQSHWTDASGELEKAAAALEGS
jgi:hypothetical protein